MSADPINVALLRLPKVELHLHLEGCIDTDLVMRWRGESEAQAVNAEVLEFQRTSPFNSFGPFVKTFRRLCGCPRSISDLVELLEHVLTAHRDRNVVYTEITVTVDYFQREFAWDIDEQVERLAAVVHRWNSVNTVQCGLLLDLADDTPLHIADRIVRIAHNASGSGVVGLNVSTDERSGGIYRFHKVVARAASKGIPISMHLGEFMDPAECLRVIDSFQPRRIGHGVRLAELPRALKYLADNEIAIELCLSSDLSSGAVGSIGDFPVRSFLDSGVAVSINTDDPVIFGIDILAEYRKYLDAGLLEMDELREIGIVAGRSGFKRESARLGERPS